MPLLILTDLQIICVIQGQDFNYKSFMLIEEIITAKGLVKRGANVLYS